MTGWGDPSRAAGEDDILLKHRLLLGSSGLLLLISLAACDSGTVTTPTAISSPAGGTTPAAATPARKSGDLPFADPTRAGKPVAPVPTGGAASLDPVSTTVPALTAHP